MTFGDSTEHQGPNKNHETSTQDSASGPGGNGLLAAEIIERGSDYSIYPVAYGVLKWEHSPRSVKGIDGIDYNPETTT